MEASIEKLKEKIDIIELIGSVVKLKKAGRNFKGLCPFHQEKTPSFVVSSERQLWHCFGACGIGGDAIAFYMRWEHLSFPEALSELGQKYGVEIRNTPIQDKQTQYKDRLINLNKKAAEFYNYILTTSPIGQKALEYVKNRGIHDKIMETFQIGYAPSSWDSLSRFLQKKGYKKGELMDAGLVNQAESGRIYDRFRGRLMFPIRDHRGNTVGFSGRILTGEKEAKYINSPETILYHKRATLYGLDITKEAVKKEDGIIIVEGEFDMITPYQHGISNIVAIKGTALTTEQLQLIKRYTNKIMLALDSDKAGEEAIRRAIEIAEPMGFELSVIVNEGGKDPDELIKQNELQFKQSIKKSIPVYDFLIDLFIKKYPPVDPFNKKRIGEEIAPFIHSIINPIVQSYYIKQLSRILDVSEDSVMKVIRTHKQKQRIFINKKEEPTTKTSRELLLQQYILESLLNSSNSRMTKKIHLILQKEDFSFPSYGIIFEKLVRFMSDNTSFAINAFIKTLPPELASVADTLYLRASSKNEGEEMSIEKIAYELKKKSLKEKLKQVLTLPEDKQQEKLRIIQTSLKELEKTSSTV